MTIPMTQIIASRDLVWTRGDGSQSTARVNVGQPLPRVNLEREIEDWYCTTQIVGLGDDRVRTVFAVDAIQALVFALRLAGVVVSASAPGVAGQLDWSEVANHGFPK